MALKRSEMANIILLGDLAKIIRSKNAGPFLLTLDVFFKNKVDYEKVKKSGVINKKAISKLYGISHKESISIIEFDQASAIKVTFRRAIPSGNIGDPDIYGAQQYAPLYQVEVPL